MRARHLFLAALGVGLAVALAPMAVEAAKRTFSFDKKGRAKVAVANRPSVTVPGGVKVTNQPAVSVANRPEVTVANRPEVAIANEPTVKVANQPSQLTALPPLERNFNLVVENVEDLVVRPLLELEGAERAAVTEVTVAVTGQTVAQPNEGRLFIRRRTSGSAPCAASSTGWELPVTLRRFAVRVGETVQLDFSAAPLVIGDGGHVCLAVQQTKWWDATAMQVGVSGFRFTAG